MTAADQQPLQPLTVTRAEWAAEHIRLFEIRDPSGAELPEFTPGAHLTVETPGGALRKYSLCNAPADRDHYLIAVKREANGRGGSVAMTDRLALGDILRVSAPRNDFPLVASPAGYTLIAGGIGITPILSMARFLKASGGRFKLFYLTRSPAETAFREELTSPHFKGSVTIHHDRGDLTAGLDLWPVLEKPRGHVYCCGPRGLMDAVRDMTGHWSSSAVHFEAFQDSAVVKPEDISFGVILKSTGTRIEVPVGTTILEALRRHGLTVPSSCESGSCGSCKTKLVSGDVDHRDLVLADYEKNSNIMVCVSRARSGDLVLDI